KLAGTSWTTPRHLLDGLSPQVLPDSVPRDLQLFGNRPNAHPSSGQNLDLHYRFLCQHPGARPPRSRTAPNSQQRWVNCFVRKGSVSDVRRHLARQYARDEIETACEKVLTLSPPS